MITFVWKLNNKMVLVTGATGLVGSHLLLKLIHEETNIRALYRTEDKKEYTLQLLQTLLNPDELILTKKIQWVKCDITDIPSLSDAFNDISEVYHCAAKISFNPARYKLLRKVNIEGTANIVNLSIIHKIKKLCHVSSIAAIGEEHKKLTTDETTAWNAEQQNSVYAITKYGAELEVWRGTQEGLKAVIVNPGIIIGQGFYNGGSGILFKSIYKGLKYHTPGITGYVDVSDVTACMFSLMKSNITDQRFILISENLSFKDIFNKIAKALQKKAPQKKATKTLMTLAMYTEWIFHKILGRKRTIFKTSIKSAFKENHYSNKKIRCALDIQFKSMDESIKSSASYFLKEHS